MAIVVSMCRTFLRLLEVGAMTAHQLVPVVYLQADVQSQQKLLVLNQVGITKAMIQVVHKQTVQCQEHAASVMVHVP
jgi:hypothetical protein